MSKYVIFVLASADAEAGKMPPAQEFIDMGAFNTELSNAGVLITADGLTDSAKGVRVTFSDAEKPQVKSAPFPVENLVAGFWILKLDSLDEAVAWAKKIPFKTGSVEIRKIAGPEDFSAEFTEEVNAKREELRRKAEGLA